MTAPHRPHANTCGLTKIVNLQNDLNCIIIDTIDTKLRNKNMTLNYLYSCNIKQ